MKKILDILKHSIFREINSSDFLFVKLQLFYLELLSLQKKFQLKSINSNREKNSLIDHFSDMQFIPNIVNGIQCSIIVKLEFKKFVSKLTRKSKIPKIAVNCRFTIELVHSSLH